MDFAENEFKKKRLLNRSHKSRRPCDDIDLY